VYYGFARLARETSAPPHAMVMNVGNRPTFADGAGLSVELHLLHEYEQDFYGEEMVAIVCGSVRAEQKFDSLDALVAQIRQDIAISEQQLAKPECQALRSDKHFD